MSDDIASNSEDDKRIFRPERRAERRSKQASTRRRARVSRFPKEVKSTRPSEPSSSSRLSDRSSSLQSSVPRNRIDPCYKLSIFVNGTSSQRLEDYASPSRSLSMFRCCFLSTFGFLPVFLFLS